MSEFYVGYLPGPPPRLARFLRRVVAGLATLAIVIALALVRGQKPLPAATFEFGTPRDFEGVVAAKPYPTLLLARPGQVAGQTPYSSYLLVAPGKHGADSLLAGFDGKRIRLRGQLIYRGSQTMVELEPDSIRLADASTTPASELVSLGPITLEGEIVDSKCYLGVMNPGQGKVHRDCAARCLSGGVPPIFAGTNGEQYVLVSPDLRPLTHGALREFVAERMRIHGELLRRGDQKLLAVDSQSLRHDSVAEQARSRPQ